LDRRWVIARLACQSFLLVVSKHIFLPSIGHVSQPKMSDGTLSLGGPDGVDETIARAVTVITD